MNAFSVVEAFEKKIASFCGAPHGIAMSTGTMAIFLSLVYERKRLGKKAVICPARTFISVPMSVLQAGFNLELRDFKWFGSYTLKPTRIVDSALRFRPQMYGGGLECLSFQARKILNIGEGGMVLTDDNDAADWLRAARYWGRKAPDFKIEDVSELGWQAYMTPEKAARGLHLMEYARDMRDGLPDKAMEYPDLRQTTFFKEYSK